MIFHQVLMTRCVRSWRAAAVTDGYGYESFPASRGRPASHALKPRLRYKVGYPRYETTKTPYPETPPLPLTQEFTGQDHGRS